MPDKPGDPGVAVADRDEQPPAATAADAADDSVPEPQAEGGFLDEPVEFVPKAYTEEELAAFFGGAAVHRSAQSGESAHDADGGDDQAE